jgi:hypothetical protein
VWKSGQWDSGHGRFGVEFAALKELDGDGSING